MWFLHSYYIFFLYTIQKLFEIWILSVDNILIDNNINKRMDGLKNFKNCLENETIFNETWSVIVILYEFHEIDFNEKWERWTSGCHMNLRKRHMLICNDRDWFLERIVNCKIEFVWQWMIFYPVINEDESSRRKSKLYILDKTIIIKILYQNWKNISKITDKIIDIDQTSNLHDNIHSYILQTMFQIYYVLTSNYWWSFFWTFKTNVKKLMMNSKRYK